MLASSSYSVYFVVTYVRQRLTLSSMTSVLPLWVLQSRRALISCWCMALLKREYIGSQCALGQMNRPMLNIAGQSSLIMAKLHIVADNFMPKRFCVKSLAQRINPLNNLTKAVKFFQSCWQCYKWVSGYGFSYLCFIFFCAGGSG